MVGKNILYYRLLAGMSQKELAEKMELSGMAISNYEKGLRNPDIETLRKLAEIFGVGVAKLLTPRSKNLLFEHGEFRKNSALPVREQNRIRESVEHYFSRFFTVVNTLGERVLPDAPQCHQAERTGDVEKDQAVLRKWLSLPESGPVGNLIGHLENRGFLILKITPGGRGFSGINGFVNGRPYIAIGGEVSPERQRSTIAHELAHLCFRPPAGVSEKEEETWATALGGAFLFPAQDAIRELGVRRSAIGKDMVMTAAEYGISMLLLVTRAKILRIVSEDIYRRFMIGASRQGWRTDEPSRIAEEQTTLMEQFSCRAVVEGLISVQKGAELLEKSYQDVERECFLEGVS